ncbi:MAG: hypothetical protein QME81_02690, partial [bacterium]|nr:hypothetical protein [bacterium]
PELQRIANPKIFFLTTIAHILTLGQEVILTSGDICPVITADPDDDTVLASAVTGRADYLITYDSHFDTLGGRYNNIQITEPLGFLFILRKKIADVAVESA